MTGYSVLIFTLTDDPFAPGGLGPHGGSHHAIATIGRYLIRSGHKVTFITRRFSDKHRTEVDFGIKGKLYRIKGGPVVPVPYFKVGHYLDEMINNIIPIVRQEQKNARLCFISYNWLSGEVVRILRKDFNGIHLHHVLALSISRFKGDEGKSKVSEEWKKFEENTFLDAEYILCGSRAEEKDLLGHYSSLKSEKVIVLNYGIDTDIFFPRPGDSNDFFRRSAEEFQKRINNPS